MAEPEQLPEIVVGDELPDAPWLTPTAKPTSLVQPAAAATAAPAEELPNAPWEDAPWATGKPEKSISWSQVPGSAIRHAPASAVQFVKDLAAPFLDIPGTAQNLAALGGGVLQYLGIMGGEDYKPYAAAVGHHLYERYFTEEGIKKALATDPVGVAGDLSMFLTGGGAAAARAPGVIGKAGKIAGTAGRVSDPITWATYPFTANMGVGRGAAEMVGGLTHVGSEPIIQAAKAGYEGGQAARDFRENITGRAPTQDAVMEVYDAINKLREQRNAAYQSGMIDISRDKSILDFSELDKALIDITGVKTFKGEVLNEATQGIREKVGQAIADWRMKDPVEYHTPEGMDALKQKISDIRDATPHGTPERLVVDKAYAAVRKTIADQVPVYNKVMRGYHEASEQMRAIQRELSHPNDKSKLNIDQALRKLQSTLRNNVNTSFGRRAELAKFLVENGAPHLMAKLAGQALQPVIPRGLGRLATNLGLEMLAALGIGGITTAGHAAAAVIPMIAVQSPRLWGEAAYWGGRAVSPAKYLPGHLGEASRQVGRTSRWSTEQEPSQQGAVPAPALEGIKAFRRGDLQESDVLAAARRALAGGKKQDEVERLLRDMGIDPSGLNPPAPPPAAGLSP